MKQFSGKSMKKFLKKNENKTISFNDKRRLGRYLKSIKGGEV